MKKKILTLVATGLMSATFFTACNKDKYNVSASDQASFEGYSAKTEEVSNVASKMEADFSTTPVEGASLKWSSGYYTVAKVNIHANAPKIGNVKYSGDYPNQHMDFNAPGIIGNITVPHGSYKKFRYTIDMVPSPDGAVSALYLKGQLTENGRNYTVRFKIDEPIQIKTDEKDVVVLSNADHVAVFSMSIKDFCASITPNMLSSLKKDGNLIIISSTSNKEVYNQFIKNLENCVKLKFKV